MIAFRPSFSYIVAQKKLRLHFSSQSYLLTGPMQSSLVQYPLCGVVILSMVSAQSSSQEYQVISQLPLTKVGLQHWASGGAAIAEKGLSTSPLTNPSLLNPSNLSLYTEVGRRLPLKWILDIKYDGQYVLPAYGSFAIPLNGVSIALGYSNYMDESFDFGRIPITTESNPEGTGSFVEAKFRRLAQMAFGTISTALTEHWRMGITFGVTFVSRVDETGMTTLKATGASPTFVAGFSGPVNETFDVGFAIRQTFEANLKSEVTPPLYLPADSGSRPTQRSLAPPPRFVARYPATATAGFSWNPSGNARLLGSLEYRAWSGVNPEFRNVFTLHIGAIIPLAEGFSTRIGFFTQPDPNPFLAPQVDQNFLTAGLEWSFDENLTLLAAIGDSHLLSTSQRDPTFSSTKDPFRQTFFGLGIAYAF